MWKALVCFFSGHKTMIKLETVVHPPVIVGDLDFSGAHAAYLFEQLIRAKSGYTSISMICPRCSHIDVIYQ
jgi:hypothetical protein